MSTALSIYYRICMSDAARSAPLHRFNPREPAERASHHCRASRREFAPLLQSFAQPAFGISYACDRRQRSAHHVHVMLNRRGAGG